MTLAKPSLRMQTRGLRLWKFKRHSARDKFGNHFLIINALEECKADLPKLLDFIAQAPGIAPVIKWAISSHNWPEIEEQLLGSRQKITLCLELKPTSVAAAVKT